MLLYPANQQLRKTNMDWLIYYNQTLGFTFLCWFKLGSHWTIFKLLNSASMHNSFISFQHNIGVDRCAGTTVSRCQIWGAGRRGGLKCPLPSFLIEGDISLQNALWYSICTLIFKKSSLPAESSWTPPPLTLSLQIPSPFLMKHICYWVRFHLMWLNLVLNPSPKIRMVDEFYITFAWFKESNTLSLWHRIETKLFIISSSEPTTCWNQTQDPEICSSVLFHRS